LVQFEVKATVGNDHPHGPPRPPLWRSAVGRTALLTQGDGELETVMPVVFGVITSFDQSGRSHFPLHRKEVDGDTTQGVVSIDIREMQ